MDDPWDLNAVIRFCSSSANSNSSVVTNTNTGTNSNPVISSENPLDCLASLTFDDDDGDIFSFPNLSQPKNNGWQELQDSYIPFLPNNITTTTTITTSPPPVAPNNIPLSTMYTFGGLNHSQLAAPLPPPPPPSFTNPTPFNLLFNNSIHQPLQHEQQHECQPPQQTPVRAVRRGPSPPAARSRKKKNVLKRQVMHVTADNLCNDVWAWRKYGQKPIKGSPYPRNYYRCSSSKGCSARKQVERSSTEPNMFIVSYAGNHDHPRPTHRNSLAGSTRNRFAASQKTRIESRELLSNDQVPAENKGLAVAVAEACSSSPVLSATSLSPTNPLSTSAASVDHTAAETVANEKPDAAGGDGDYDDYDYDDILIPNFSFNEDMIKDFQELSGGSSHSPDFADNFSPWSAAGATGDGGR